MPPEPIPPEVRAARRDVSRLVTERDSFLREAVGEGVVDHARLNEIDERIAGRLDDILALVDPCDASATEPLVLLPVRLETRFGSDNGTPDVARPHLPGRDSRRRSRTRPDGRRGKRRRGLLEGGLDRSGSRSSVDGVRCSGGCRARRAGLRTPEHRRTSASAVLRPRPTFRQAAAQGPRNVVARALPDRFVVLAVQGGQVSQAVGRPVPRDLSLSPIPLEGDEPERIADALTIPPGSEWLVDYDRAVEVGMAVTVPLAGGAGTSRPRDRSRYAPEPDCRAARPTNSRTCSRPSVRRRARTAPARNTDQQRRRCALSVPGAHDPATARADLARRATGLRHVSRRCASRDRRRRPHRTRRRRHG